MNKIVIDLDDTLTVNDSSPNYAEKSVNVAVCERLKEYRSMGFTICIHTARNMNSFKGDIGKINKNTVPTIIAWLEKNDIPFDELIVGKPWCGPDGFYVDDRAIRPSEFVKLEKSEITELLKTND